MTYIGITEERPDWRGTLTTTYQTGRFHALGRTSYYGKFSSAQPGFCDLCRERYGAKTLFDLELGYRLSPVKLSLGAKNIFNTYPDRPSSTVVVDSDGDTSKDFNNNFGTFPWAAASPFGYNGRYLYTRSGSDVRLVGGQTGRRIGEKARRRKGERATGDDPFASSPSRLFAYLALRLPPSRLTRPEHPGRQAKQQRNPQTSVKVVTKIEEAMAGSMPNRLSSRGMNAPAKPATKRFPVIARNTTRPSLAAVTQQRGHHTATTPFTAPFTSPASISLPMTRSALPAGTSPKATRRTVTARAWVPPFPPIPAMIGIQKIRARTARDLPLK